MIDKIIGTARLEPGTVIPRITGATISKQDAGLIIAKTLANPFSLYKTVSITEKPVSFDTFEPGDPDVILTRGVYTVTYIPESRGHARPFRISQDLVKGTFTVWDWPHWCRLCAAVPEFGWLQRNTNISKELFGLAKCHPGLGLQFVVDWVRYGKMINEKAKAEKLNIEHRPFVSYHCSYQDFDDKFSKKLVAKPKTIHDYKEQFESALRGSDKNKED